MRTTMRKRFLPALPLVLAPLVFRSAHAAPCTLTAEDVDTYLDGKSSPLVGAGVVLVQQGSAWNVDPRLVIAIAGAESTFGNRVCGENNAWNWFHGRTCANSPFDSWSSGAATITKYLRLSYLNKGMTTVETIGARYCQSGCENWVPLVTRFYATELGGDLADLGCAPECAAATCATFTPCATPAAGCQAPVCGRLAGTTNGQCVEGTTPCAGLSDCNSSRDCPGGACLADSCCGRNVCVPAGAFCSSNAAAQQRQALPLSIDGPTVGWL